MLSVIEERHRVDPGPPVLSNHEENILLKGAYGTSDDVIHPPLITLRTSSSDCVINIV